jgi:hypothetical protein
MGTTLTGTTPATTYDSLIKVGDNGPIDGTLQRLSDGLGNDLPLLVSTTALTNYGGVRLRLIPLLVMLLWWNGNNRNRLSSVAIKYG